MKPQLEILHIWTSDNLRLQGVHYKAEIKDTCVLFIHGMSGNFIENYFAHILGKTLAENGIGFIYAHNRGYGHINDIVTKEIKEDSGYKTVRIGAMYERFSECIYDIDGWLKKCRVLGYKKIVLLGHSLGCNKTVHYFSKKRQKNVIGIILASPPDIVGLFEKPEYQANHKELFEEAKRNIKEGKPRKIVSGIVWDWYQLSSQTYVDLSERNGLADNLPVLRNPKEFSELASINVPILGIMGEHDDIAIRTLKDDLDLIASKAINCPSFTKRFVKGANHNYERQEKDFAKIVLKWIMEVLMRENEDCS